MIPLDLSTCDHWIFDLDGTLTEAVHDFDAIRAQLGLEPGIPILEQLQQLPNELATQKRTQLQDIEIELAARGVMQEGAADLLERLRRRGARIGILTRNSKTNARVTLDAAGIGSFFDDDDIIGRDCTAPKPSPDGVRRLLDRWHADPNRAVVVGDYLFDLQAGRGAGAGTVFFDPADTGEWSEFADIVVKSYGDLLRLAGLD